MNKNKLLSILMIGLMSLSLMACGTKETTKTPGGENQGNVEVEETNLSLSSRLPEQDLVTDYLKTHLLGREELAKEGINFYNFYWLDAKVEQTFLDKYNLKMFEGDYMVEDLYNLNPTLFGSAVNTQAISILFEENNIVYLAERDFMPMAQDYIANVWMGEEVQNLKISDEFAALDPQKNFKNYLKKNDIVLENIVYPTKATDLNPISGHTVLVAPITVEYTQNGESKNETFYLEFYLTLSKELREGKAVETFSYQDFEIMAVSIASNPKETIEEDANFKYDIALKGFGLAK